MLLRTAAAAGARPAALGRPATSLSAAVSRPVRAARAERKAKQSISAVAEVTRASKSAAGDDNVDIRVDNAEDAKCTVVHISAKNKPGAFPALGAGVGPAAPARAAPAGGP